MSKERDIFDFKQDIELATSFAADYLRQYYHPTRPVTDDEAAVYRFIRKISGQLSGEINCLEVGCGPTIHHALMLAPFVSSITLADYLEENLKFVQSWREEAADAWNWSAYTRFCIAEDGLNPSDEKLIERESLARRLITDVRPINLLLERPLGDGETFYDLVASFYCTEEIALTTERWKEVMKSVASLIKPGGYLLISCLENTDFYHICADDGQVRELPCAKISRLDLAETLRELDFIEEQTAIEIVRTPSQEKEGVPGVLLAFAKKKSSI